MVIINISRKLEKKKRNLFNYIVGVKMNLFMNGLNKEYYHLMKSVINMKKSLCKINKIINEYKGKDTIGNDETITVLLNVKNI